MAGRRTAAAVAGPLADALGAVQWRDGTVVPHDAVAAVALVEPDLFAWSTRSVRCETAGAVTTGATVVDRRHTPLDGGVAVAEDVDVDRVNDRILAAPSDDWGDAVRAEHTTAPVATQERRAGRVRPTPRD